MASVHTGYDIFLTYIKDGTLDLDNDPIKVALLTNVYTPDFSADAVFADVSAHELAAGNGYTQGGIALTNLLVDNQKFDSDDVVFTNLGSPNAVTFRYAVVYVDATKGSVIRPLISSILIDDTPADVVAAGTNFGIQWSTSGIITSAIV